MKKNVGLTYVSEFSFPPEQGFTGSAGKGSVKGYMRGGKVKASNNASGKANAARAAKKPMTPAMKGGYMEKGMMKGGKIHADPGPLPKNVKMRGGMMKKAKGGTVGVTTEAGPRSRRPKNTMTAAMKGGHMKKAGGGKMSMHDKLYAEGGKMGYAKGGQVKQKNTSSEFLMKSGPQDSMDHGVQPAKKGNNQAEIEAGGTKRLKPKFKMGGKVKGVHKVRMAKKAKGGSLSVGALGGGAAAKAARAIRSREERVRSTVDEALSAASKSRSGGSPRPKARVQDSPPKRTDRIYREDKKGVPTFTDVPKMGKRMGKRGAGR